MHPVVGPEIGVREGDVIAGKYRIDRVIGVGGMGVVVAAHHLALDELVAIKLLLPDALRDAEAVRRFEREARAAVKIKSEHVARIIDVGELDSGVPFIVMEYLQGEDLADRLARTGPLAIEDAIALLLQACEAVAEAHVLGIVHRDLKPANLFCVQGPDGYPTIKVLDFGISKIMAGGAGSSGLGMTKTRAMMGSPYYMSPEQMESPRAVDARSDIWSLGVVLFQLLTGRVPFSGETLPQVCVNVATRPAPPLRRFRADVPTGLESAVLRCLEKDPAKRYPHIGALATALGRFGPRRAEPSVDRIHRTWRRSTSSRGGTSSSMPSNRPTDRPVTGTVPSWSGTTKSSERSALGVVTWVATGFVTVVVVLMWTRQHADVARPNEAVLVTPPRSTDLDMGTASSGADSPAPKPKTAPVDSAMVAAGSEIPGAPSLPASSAGTLPPAAENGLSPATTGTTNSGAVAAVARPSTVAEATDIAEPGSSVSALETPYAPTESAPAKTPPGPRPCRLNLNSRPASFIVIDGTPIGSTPKTGYAVTPGQHRVTFHASDGSKTMNVMCPAGESVTVAVPFDDTRGDDLPINPYR